LNIAAGIAGIDCSRSTATVLVARRFTGIAIAVEIKAFEEGAHASGPFLDDGSSFRGDAQHRTTVRNCAPENLEIPGSRLRAPRNDVGALIWHHR
jgi:hypothetical protein